MEVSYIHMEQCGISIDGAFQLHVINELQSKGDFTKL